MPAHHHHAAICAIYLATALIFAAHADIPHALCAFAIAWVYASARGID